MPSFLRNPLLSATLIGTLLSATLAQSGCAVDSPDTPRTSDTNQAVLGPEWIPLGVSWLSDGTIVWAWTKGGYVMAAAGATEAEALAVASGTAQGSIYVLSTPAAGGGAAAGGAAG